MKVSPKQIELLLDFMERHSWLARGRVRGKEGSQVSSRLWQDCAEILNAEFPGAVKDAKGWKKYYTVYKSRTTTKSKKKKQDLRGTGGGPPQGDDLTPLEERLCGILSNKMPENDSSLLRHNPIEEQTEDLTTTTAPASATELDDMQVNADNAELIGQYLVVDIENYNSSITPQPTLSQSIENYNSSITPQPTLSQSIENYNSSIAAAPQPTLLQSIENINTSNDTASQPTLSQRASKRKRQTDSRRPRRRVSPSFLNPANQTGQNTFEAAAKSLADMEQQRLHVDNRLADVVAQHAAAMGRHADSMEDVAIQIRRFVDIYAHMADSASRRRRPRRRRLLRRIRVISSSEEE